MEGEWPKMDKQQIGKYMMIGLGALLTLGANLVNNRNQEIKMEETIEEKVKEALDNQTKESV